MVLLDAVIIQQNPPALALVLDAGGIMEIIVISQAAGITKQKTPAQVTAPGSPIHIVRKLAAAAGIIILKILAL